MNRKILILVGIATVAGAILGAVAVGERFLLATRTKTAYPAPARVPQVIGLPKQEAVKKIVAAHLRPDVRYVARSRHPTRVSGRVIIEGMSRLLHAPGLPPISLEGTPVTITVVG